MDITLKHISEEEFELFFSFVAGYQQMGTPEEPDKALAIKIFKQLVPIAKRVYGFEYDKIMSSIEGLKHLVANMNVTLEKKYPSDRGQN